ncbi:unnamed protein product [Boreogadus saida]
MAVMHIRPRCAASPPFRHGSLPAIGHAGALGSRVQGRVPRAEALCPATVSSHLIWAQSTASHAHSSLSPTATALEHWIMH